MGKHLKKHFFWLVLIADYLAYREYLVASMVVIVLFKDMRIVELENEITRRDKTQSKNASVLDTINAEIKELGEYKEIFFNNYGIKSK